MDHHIGFAWAFPRSQNDTEKTGLMLQFPIFLLKLKS